MDELTMLREQMASMKQSLDKSEIINKSLLKKVMRQRSSWLANTVWMEVVATPILAIIIYLACINADISIWFAIIFFVGSAIDTAFDYKTLRIPGIWFSEMDVVTLRKQLLHQKLQRKKQYIISVSGAALWGLWFGFEYIGGAVKEHITLDAISIAIILSVVGLIVFAGVWLSLVIYRRAQRTNDDLIGQIDEYEKES